MSEVSEFSTLPYRKDVSNKQFFQNLNDLQQNINFEEHNSEKKYPAQIATKLCCIDKISKT